MHVGVDDLLGVIGPFCERHGFRCREVKLPGDDRARVGIDTFRRLMFEAYSLDAYGNVGVDVDAGGERRAYTGPLPDLEKLLDEAYAEIERGGATRPFATS